jgi:hypothetical protein
MGAATAHGNGVKKLLVLLVFVACNREPVVESTSGPVDKTTTTDTAPSTTRRPEDPTTPKVNGPKLAFIDEASKDPSFAAYREQLVAAVRARDAKTLLALSNPKIRTSFGSDGGAVELKRVLKEDLWRELEQILGLGGTFREGMFWAPYVYSAWPESHDAFETLAVVADDVPLRASPDANAPAIATLSRDLVTRASEPRQDGAWEKIATADGKSGFVESKFVRSPVDYRAGFVKTPNGWRMNALVAGD